METRVVFNVVQFPKAAFELVVAAILANKLFENKQSVFYISLNIFM